MQINYLLSTKVAMAFYLLIMSIQRSMGSKTKLLRNWASKLMAILQFVVIASVH